MKSINTVTICLVLLVTAGCGDFEQIARIQKTQKTIQKTIQKTYEKGKAEADRKSEEVNQRMDELKDENSELRKKFENSELRNSELRKKFENSELRKKGREKKLFQLALSVLGAITAINFFGKPVARMSACIVLKHCSPSPRQVLPIQTKGEDSDETRLEPA